MPLAGAARSAFPQVQAGTPVGGGQPMGQDFGVYIWVLLAFTDNLSCQGGQKM